MENLIRGACLNNYLEVAQSVGIDPVLMLRRAGLDSAIPPDQDARIPAGKFHLLLEHSARAAAVEDFGLRMAATRRLSNLGPLWLAVREEPTIFKALESLGSHMHLHNEAIVLRLEEAGALTIVKLELLDNPNRSRQALELVVAVIYRMIQELAGGNWKPIYVAFSHSSPSDVHTYRRIFNCAVEFGLDFNGIVCMSSQVKTPLPTYDPIAARYVKQFLDPMLGRPDVSMGTKVRRLVREALLSGHCSIDNVAESLGVTRRTIHRHLAIAGETYSDIVGEIRTELVMQYVASQVRPLSEIADLLDFSSLSAFCRWFRKRFGSTISEYRASRVYG